MNCFREKLRTIEYNKKLERISKLEEELKVNLTELKNRKNNIVSREKEIEEKNEKLKAKEERLKTLVEDEKRRSINNVQSSTKELKLEANSLRTENYTLKSKLGELEISLTNSKNHENQLRKNQSLIDETNSRNEILTKRISDLEAKLELSQSQQSFYKKRIKNCTRQNF